METANQSKVAGTYIHFSIYYWTIGRDGDDTFLIYALLCGKNLKLGGDCRADDVVTASRSDSLASTCSC